MHKRYKTLDKVNLPEDLRKLDRSELKPLCDDLRSFLLDQMARNSEGHLGSNLGVVELTTAIHYAYDTPHDSIVWDVGHQAYIHKILTGRKEDFSSNRKYNGMSGFPKRSESRYDDFGVGHASTSISAAMGLSVAAERGGVDKKVIAVIGDGSMTGGLAFEALNNAANISSDLLIILNDNNMAIDPNIGGLNSHLTTITASKQYNRIKGRMSTFLSKFGKFPRKFGAKALIATKSFLMRKSNLFEGLNIRYFGPVDGHNVESLVKLFHDLQDVKGPKLLHVVTKKGKGFKPAEKDQTKWHAVSKSFNTETGESLTDGSITPIYTKFQDVFGRSLLQLAKDRDDIVAITPAMPTGSSLTFLQNEFPERVYDVGIAEGHAVTFSAGLAAGGALPFCCIYSSFLQRGYDQVVHDVAIQNLKVIFCIDRGGVVGADGATHHGVLDIAFMRNIPNMVVAAPMDEIELRSMLYTATYNSESPFSIRYPRGTGQIEDWEKPFEPIKIGEGEMICDGEDIAILTIGTVGTFAKDAVEELAKQNISAAHYNMRYAKPLDLRIIKEVASKFNKIITVEDGVIAGGFGSAVLEACSDINYTGKVTRLGVPDYFVSHGTQKELYRECGYDSEGIVKSALEILKSR